MKPESQDTALRRVATLVARGTPQEEVFATVVEQVGRLLRARYASLHRYASEAQRSGCSVVEWAIAA
jgi:GAF domain-containing protein